MPADGTVIHRDSSVHYEVVTDRWNSNTATITYDVYDWPGDKGGEVDLHLSVPGSRWNSETRSCDARGAVVCTAYRDAFSVFSGDAREGHPDFYLGDNSCPVTKGGPTRSPRVIWPADRSWCVATTEIDLRSTPVGGSAPEGRP